MKTGIRDPLIFFLSLGLVIILIVVINQNLRGNLPFPDIFKKSLSLNAPSPVEKQIIVGDTKVFVEIANSPAEKSKGLSGRKNIAENEGMLFVFTEKDIIPSFWMKGMLFPIDIIWISNGQVVQLDKNIQPEPGTPNAELKHYRPLKPVDYVLEVNAGFSSENSISIGNEVDLSQIESN